MHPVYATHIYVLTTKSLYTTLDDVSGNSQKYSFVNDS